jgi:hypothetical protein
MRTQESLPRLRAAVAADIGCDCDKMDDPLDQPIHDLAGACRAKGLAEESFFLLPVGATRRLPRRLGYAAAVEPKVEK